MRYLLIVVASWIAFSSCKVFRSNLMLKTPKDFKYDKLVDSLGRMDYRIAPNDGIQYRVFPNNGFKLIDLATTSQGVSTSSLDVVVESDGQAKMPMLGRVKLAGYTIPEAEKMLEERYDSLYNNSFVNLRVTNKRVIVFPGNGGQARVILLTNNNTTIIEAIANAGGIVEDGKAYKVKLIRENPDHKAMPFVYLLDLSEIGGIMDAKSRVQAGDIIYVEPRYRPLATFNREFAPFITLLSTVLILYQITLLAKSQ